MTIGQKIREKRIQAGLSQVELGKRLGLTRSTICKLEKEDGVNITTERLKRVADALGCSPYDLLDTPTIKIDHFEATIDYGSDMKILIEYYNSLDTGQKERVLEYARLLSGDKKNDDTKEK